MGRNTKPERVPITRDGKTTFGIRHKKAGSDSSNRDNAASSAAAMTGPSFPTEMPNGSPLLSLPDFENVRNVGTQRAASELEVSHRALVATRFKGEKIKAVNTEVSGEVNGVAVNGVIPMISRRDDGTIMCESFVPDPNGIRLATVTANGSGVKAVGPDTSTATSELAALASVLQQQTGSTLSLIHI